MRFLMLRALVLAALAAAASLPAGAAEEHAAAPQPTAEARPMFTEQTGEALYTNVCQGCHMADAKGAAGAGRYPELAENPKLEVAGYPVSMVVLGQNAMPAVGKMMSDAQVAAVVNYVRTHFGNNYTDAVKPEDVAAARQ